MPREQIIVPSRDLSYEGYFSVKDVQDMVYTFLKQRDYMRKERGYEHKQFADGAVIETRAFHEKQIDGNRFEFDMFFTFSKIKDVEVTIHGEKKKVNSGKVSIAFKGILFSDVDVFEHEEWKKSEKNFGFGAFIRWVGEAFVFKSQMNAIKKACIQDVDDLYSTLLEYFNAQSYRRYS